MRCAVEWNRSVVQNHRTDRKNELGKWAGQFRLLRTQDGASKDLIKEGLKWYVSANWSDEFLPQAYSGQSFRQKFFDKILPAMRRDAGEEDYAVGYTVLSEDSVEVITREEWSARLETMDREELIMTVEEYDDYRLEWEKTNGERYIVPGVVEHEENTV